jgi:hypothetical protein
VKLGIDEARRFKRLVREENERLSKLGYETQLHGLPGYPPLDISHVLEYLVLRAEHALVIQNFLLDIVVKAKE